MALAGFNIPAQAMNFNKAFGVSIGTSTGIIAAMLLQENREQALLDTHCLMLVGASLGYARYSTPVIKRIAQRRLSQLNQHPVLKIDTTSKQSCIEQVNALYGGKTLPAPVMAAHELEYLKDKALDEKYDLGGCLPAKPEFFKACKDQSPYKENAELYNLHKSASDLYRKAYRKELDIEKHFNSEIQE